MAQFFKNIFIVMFGLLACFLLVSQNGEAETGISLDRAEQTANFTAELDQPQAFISQVESVKTEPLQEISDHDQETENLKESYYVEVWEDSPDINDSLSYPYQSIQSHPANYRYDFESFHSIGKAKNESFAYSPPIIPYKSRYAPIYIPR